MTQNELADKLKSCPLCGTINTSQSWECVVCSWHGAFDTETSELATGMEELLRRYPDLGRLVSESQSQPSLFQRLKACFYPGT